MFHEKLKEIRKEKNLTQEALAKHLMISKQTISKWETGVSMPDLDMVVKLSEFFGVSTDILLKDRKSNSEFSYYTVMPDKKRTMTRYQLVAIVLFILSTMTILTLWIVTIVEPKVYTNHLKEFDGFLAYCYIYPEFFIGFIFVIFVLFLSIVSFFISEDKLDRFFHKKK